MVWVIIAFVAGVAGGYILKAFITNRQKVVGTLRVDHSEPSEEPYLFLELKKDGIESIQKKKEVLFKVDLDSYLPRK